MLWNSGHISTPGNENESNPNEFLSMDELVDSKISILSNNSIQI